MKPWYELDISVDGALVFDPRTSIQEDPYQQGQELYMPDLGGVWYFDQSSIINPVWRAQFSKKTRRHITGLFVFWRSENYQHPSAHIDSFPRVDAHGNTELWPTCAGFNWVLERDDTAAMTWYEPWWDPQDIDQACRAVQGKMPHPDHRPDTVNSGTMYYQETPIELLTETHRHSLSDSRVTLTRTDIPHNVLQGKMDRWCVSLRTFPVIDTDWNALVAELNDVVDF